jgi:hypothetical protein
MLKRIHPIAGIVAMLTILTFWISTATSELFLSIDSVVAVKRVIPWGLLVLVPALIVTGASGFRMAGAAVADPRLARKKRRMPFIAANGILILIPAALYLAALATRREFDGLFYAVQALELTAGAVNLVLMSLNVRDGLALTGRINDRRTQPGRRRAPVSAI